MVRGTEMDEEILELPVLVGRRWNILEILYDGGGDYLSALVDKIGEKMKLSDMSNYISELEKSGLVITSFGAIKGKRGRIKNVELTPLGREVVEFYKTISGEKKKLEDAELDERLESILYLLHSEKHDENVKERVVERFAELSNLREIEGDLQVKALYEELVSKRKKEPAKGYWKKIQTVFRAISMQRIVKDADLKNWFMESLYRDICKQARNNNLDEAIRLSAVIELNWVYDKEKPDELYELFKEIYFDEKTVQGTELVYELNDILSSAIRDNKKLREDFYSFTEKDKTEETIQKALIILDRALKTV